MGLILVANLRKKFSTIAFMTGVTIQYYLKDLQGNMLSENNLEEPK